MSVLSVWERTFDYLTPAFESIQSTLRVIDRFCEQKGNERNT